MDGEASWVYERMKLYELLEMQPNLSNRQYARLLGHDHNWVRKWRLRFRDAEPITVKSFQSHSRAPKTPPERISEAAKEIVCQLREVELTRYDGHQACLLVVHHLRFTSTLANGPRPTFRLELDLQQFSCTLTAFFARFWGQRCHLPAPKTLEKALCGALCTRIESFRYRST
jgi:hypothetical protein